MEEVRSIEPGASDLVGTRSRANLGRTFDGNIRSTASDRIRVPARPAQHVHISVPDMRRRTRRSASTTAGGARHMTIGRAEADQAGARPYQHRCAGTRRDMRRHPVAGQSGLFRCRKGRRVEDKDDNESKLQNLAFSIEHCGK